MDTWFAYNELSNSHLCRQAFILCAVCSERHLVNVHIEERSGMGRIQLIQALKGQVCTETKGYAQLVNL